VNWYLPTRWDLNQLDEAQLFASFRRDPYGTRLGTARTPAEVVEADRFGLEQAIHNVLSNPRAYLASRARVYPHLFLNSFDSLTGLNQSFGSLIAERRMWAVLLKLTLLALFALLPLALALLGLAAQRRSLIALLCASVWIATAVAHMPMWIEFRFWTPALPILLVNAAAGVPVSRLLTKWTASR
jgi:hypothetical protein